jgi:tetratricopeptide (TPR) repeat protein
MRCVTRLKEVIYYLGTSAEKVARDVGVSTKQMYNYINGQAVVPENLRHKLADCLHCDEDFLFPHPAEWLKSEPVREENMKRREFLLSAGAFAFPHGAPDTALRLAHILAHPLKLDEQSMCSLEQVVASAWLLDPGFTKGVSPDAILYVDEQIKGVTSLLSENPASYSNRLYSVSGELCMLSAWMLREIGQPDQAIVRLMLALQSATRANNHALIADMKARLALLLVHHGGEDAALPYALSAAKHAALAGESITPRRRGWVFAIGAECHAGLGNERECLQALEIGEQGLQYDNDDDYYTVAFSPVVFSGFKAMSLFKLGRLDEAHAEFERSLTKRLSTYRKSHKLVDLAAVEVAEGEIEQAAVRINQAIDLALDVHSPLLNGHIVKMRKLLIPYSDNAQVRQLNEYIVESGLLPPPRSKR